MEAKIVIGLAIAIFSLLWAVALAIWASWDYWRYPSGRRPYRGGVGRDWK